MNDSATEAARNIVLHKRKLNATLEYAALYAENVGWPAIRAALWDSHGTRLVTR